MLDAAEAGAAASPTMAVTAIPTAAIFVRIPIRTYRAIRPAITEDGVLFDGEVIPITKDNTAKLIDAIYHLRIQLDGQEKKNQQLRDSAPFTRFETRIGRCLGEVSGKLRRGLDDSGREQLLAMLDALTGRIRNLRQRVEQPPQPKS